MHACALRGPALHAPQNLGPGFPPGIPRGILQLCRSLLGYTALGQGVRSAILIIFVKSGERLSDGMDLESRQNQPVTVSKAALEHIDD